MDWFVLCLSVRHCFTGRWGKRKGFGQDVNRLEIGRRAQRKTFFAIPALFGGYLWDETDFFSDASVNKAHSVFLFYLSTVPDAQAAMDTK